PIRPDAGYGPRGPHGGASPEGPRRAADAARVFRPETETERPALAAEGRTPPHQSITLRQEPHDPALNGKARHQPPLRSIPNTHTVTAPPAADDPVAAVGEGDLRRSTGNAQHHHLLSRADVPDANVVLGRPR